MKTLMALLCAAGIGLSGIAYAGADIGSAPKAKPPVDCKKNPTNPQCKGKK